MANEVSIPNLVAEHTGTNTYTVRSMGGAELKIGAPGAEGVFTPVELLQAAIAGCASLSAEAQLASQLGSNFDAAVTVAADYNAEENRVEKLITQLSVDMSELDSEQRDKLVDRADRLIDKLCTVKRSLGNGVAATTEVQSKDS